MPMATEDLGRDEEKVFGYDFEDKQTRLQLELMDELQKLGVSEYLDLPQLVVVGDQSTGKSSVLRAVTEIAFPVDENMCTRFATEVILRRTLPDKPTSIKMSIIPAADETPERKRALLHWKPEGFDFSATLDKAMMKSAFEQAEKMIFGVTPKRNPVGHSEPGTSRLSSSILRIERSGPKETNFAIVDVPGLVRGNDADAEHRTATSLVRKYLDNLRSIIVVVIDVVDLERQEIFHMLNGLPDEESRVIGVINKCDTKQKQSHEWVFDLIRNQDQTHSRRYLKEGWYGLRNRQASEINSSDQERDKLEQDFFAKEEWRPLDQGKLGRHHLKRALIKMRNRHVKRSIPELLSEIQSKLNLCDSHISQLGDPRISDEAQFSIVNRIASKYSRLADGALKGHYELLSEEKLFARKLIRQELLVFEKTMVNGGLAQPFRTCRADAEIIAKYPESEWADQLMKISTYAWIRHTIEAYRAKEDIDEVNPPVKSRLWKQQTVNWNKIAVAALDNIQRIVDDVIADLFRAACPDDELRAKLQDWLQDDFTKASENARIELQRLVEGEIDASLFTLHPGRQERKQWYHEARVQAITAKLHVVQPETALLQAATPASSVNPISAEVIINSLLYGNAELVGVLNTHDSLAAYYDIALYRFIDNFALQVVERHLLGPMGPLRLFNSEYVTTRLYGENHKEVLNSLAGEDPAVTQKRVDLDAKKRSLEESRKRVQNFRVL